MSLFRLLCQVQDSEDPGGGGLVTAGFVPVLSTIPQMQRNPTYVLNIPFPFLLDYHILLLILQQKGV